MTKAATNVAAHESLALPTATPYGAAVFSFHSSMVGALRVAACAATPRAATPPTATPNGVVLFS